MTTGSDGDLPGVAIRPLEGWSDFAACLEVQRAVWGDDPRELVPPIVLEATLRAGGLLGGAFDGEGRLIGFVYGFPAVRGGRLAHWSHLLAVLPEARRSHLGTLLKRWQREELLAVGIDRACWSYDPLLAANAHLNLTVLGAEVIEHVEDMYGDEVRGTAGSDRFVVEWALDAADVASTGDPAAIVHPEDGSLPAGPAVGVAVPTDFTSLAAGDPEAALRWRISTRRAFNHYLSRDYRVTGFRRGDPPHYVLEARR